MDDKKQNLQEQDHPLKNTDNAFVQIGKKGESLTPWPADNNRDIATDNDKDEPVASDKP